MTNDKKEMECDPAEELLLKKNEEFRRKIERLAKAGVTIPAGGVFYLTREIMVLATIAEMKQSLAHALQIPVELVEVEIEHEAGGIKPTINVGIPEAWFKLRGYKPANQQEMKMLIGKHVEGMCRAHEQKFFEIVRNRLEFFDGKAAEES